MAVLKELRIPHMGSVENAKLVSWHVGVGAPFLEGQVLYEIETDKTVTEVQAESAGVLVQQIANESAELKVGDLVGVTADEGATADDIARAIEETLLPRNSGVIRGKVGQNPVPTPVAVPPSARISPRARRLAQEQGVDLAALAGKADGRVSGEDVLRMSGGIDAASGTTPGIPGYERLEAEIVPNSTRRRAIARRLVESRQVAPQLTADMQVDLSALMSVRAALNSKQKERGRPAISILSFIAQATVALLVEHPDLNASYLESHRLRWRVVNLGIAVDTPDGLVVPVISNAASLSLAEMNSAIASLAAQARAGTLRQQDLEAGTFTISNPGSLGPVLRAEAILNPPQVALLGLPGIQYMPIALESEDFRIEVRPILRPSITFDHRALDGGQVIHFLNALKAKLESTSWGVSE